MALLSYSFDDLNISSPTAVCLGNFDGFHLGHQKIIRICLEAAAAKSYSSLLFSFTPHPRRQLGRTKEELPLLLTDQEKAELAHRMGLEKVLLQKFDSDFRSRSAESFIEEILIQKLQSEVLVVGKDFRFGFQAKGCVNLLRKYSEFELIEVSDVETEGKRVSSSVIRQAVQAGHIEEANLLLGHPYFLNGTVIRGDGRGKSIGVPTANLATQRECLPQNGVYLGVACQKERYFIAAINIGERPSFEAGFSIEAHLLDFSEDFYDQDLKLYFIKKIRDEKRFSTAEQLQFQISQDLQKIRSEAQAKNLLQAFMSNKPL